jgi:hypothetical protein
MNKKIKTILVIFFVCFIGLTSANFVFAEPNVVQATEKSPFSNLITGIDEKFVEKADAGKNVFYYIGVVIKNFLGIVSAFLVVMVLYAGFLWMTAGGNQDQVTKARKWITNGVVGLIVTMSAFAITDYVFERVYSTEMSILKPSITQEAGADPISK